VLCFPRKFSKLRIMWKYFTFRFCSTQIPRKKKGKERQCIICKHQKHSRYTERNNRDYIPYFILPCRGKGDMEERSCNRGLLWPFVFSCAFSAYKQTTSKVHLTFWMEIHALLHRGSVMVIRGCVYFFLFGRQKRFWFWHYENINANSARENELWKGKLLFFLFPSF
jgi:hypothetical protein